MLLSNPGYLSVDPLPKRQLTIRKHLSGHKVRKGGQSTSHEDNLIEHINYLLGDSRAPRPSSSNLSRGRSMEIAIALSDTAEKQFVGERLTLQKGTIVICEN
jgi:hypothetical protein